MVSRCKSLQLFESVLKLTAPLSSTVSALSHALTMLELPR